MRWRLTKVLLSIILEAVLLGHGLSARAQIFSGVSDSGSVVLTNIASNEAHTVIVSAGCGAAFVMCSGSVASKKSTSTRVAAIPPEAFQPFILEASVASGLPTALIHAVIKTESNYNPHALSQKGALGLMQLMPATAKRFGGADSLDPRENIMVGSRYLRWLMDYFNQDIELAVAAYNAGEGAVVRAGRKIPPFPETQRYVPKVLSTYRQALGIV